MLQSHNILSTVISVSNRGNYKFYKFQIYRWNPKDNRIEPVKTSTGYIISGACLLSFVIYLQRIQTVPQWLAVQGYLGCMLLCLAFLNFFHNKNNGLVSAFVNGLLQYENETIQFATANPSPTLIKLILLFCNLLKYSLSHGVPVCMTIMSVLLPTSPLNILHAWVGSNQIRTKSYYGFARLSLNSGWTAALVGLFHYTFWKMGVMMLEVTTTLTYLTSLYALFMAVRLHVSHMASGGCGIASADYLKAISFRKVQLLTGVYNELHRHSLQIVMAVSLATAFTVCTYLGIRASAKGELVILAFSLIVAINCGLGILVCFGLGAKVYSESRTAMSKLKSASPYYRRRSSWYRKLVRSFPIQKIQISNNYFEPMTPLIIEESCIAHTITLLLLT